MSKKKGILLRILFLLLLLPAFPAIVKGQTGSSSLSYPLGASSQASSITTTDFTGRVIKIESNQITIQSGNDTRIFTIPNNISIKKNGTDVQFNDIQIDDQVTVTLDPNNLVLKLSITSGSFIDGTRIVLIGGVLVVAILAVLYFIFRNQNKGHIKTFPNKS